MSQEWRRAALPKVAEFRGREIEMDGNSIVAVFDGPVRAIRCAQSVVSAMREYRIPGRAGVHTSEFDVWSDKLEEEIIQICSGVANISSPGEVVITGAVADLVAGSGLHLYPRGAHVLDGVPGQWTLHAAM
jgi:class 3 adenylate cyclase